jgi:ribokinase
MKVSVVGHVEWIEFVRVEHVPARGEIVHALEAWAEAAGGGSVAAVQLARLAGASTLFTAVGDDEYGRRMAPELEGHGVRVEAAVRPEPQRHGFTYVDAGAERTITVIGDPDAVRAARAARVLVATARSLPALEEAGVELDALVRSGSDEGERYRPGDLHPPPRLEVATAGEFGGTYSVAGGKMQRYVAAPVPGEVKDTYGAGDSFAAGLTYGLASGLIVEDALALGARCGAEALARPGAHGSS